MTMMDQIRAAFNNMFNSERYSRFAMHPEEEAGSHMEVKLSNEALDDTTEVTGQPGGSPSFRPKTRRNNCYWTSAVLLVIFAIGCLLGYACHRVPQPKPASCGAEKDEGTAKDEEPKSMELRPEPSLDWGDVTRLLSQKLTLQAFQETLSEFDQVSREAGSAEDVHLGNRIYEEFKKQEMDPWTDIHHVQLQKQDSERPNHVLFGSDDFQPKGYLAYSANGTVQGKVVYGNYGRPQDLDVVQKKNIEMKGCVMLLRAGRVSFAQQVANAAGRGASAVLIYPDPQDFRYEPQTELYGHVHLGSGDPYTPGFPSFEKTQFPPTKSSGLPTIPAQTITAQTAATIIRNIAGPEVDASFKGGIPGVTYRLGGVENITVEVNNVLVKTEIHNVFGVIKGYVDPDRYVVLGAQRDAWGRGYARATVGTTLLIELAKAVHEMVEKDGFKPRRSLVFASWSAGEYGSVGSTEWLEAYMSSLDKKAFTYISLDGAVMGRGSFIASASPLLQSLLESTMKGVINPVGSGTVYDMMGGTNWEKNTLRPMSMEDPAYPFLAFSGVPSVSFHFISPNTEAYPYYGTSLDNMDHLSYQTNQRTGQIAVLAGQFAGQMALRLVHDHLLSLDVSKYSTTITGSVVQLYRRISQLSQSGKLENVSPKWLNDARGSFQRSAASLKSAIDNTDLSKPEACRILNDRIMAVEHTLLSPYVVPQHTPFRHLLLGRGPHTLAAIAETTDMEQLRVQLALATWTLQGCADAMAENIWDIDNEI